MTVSTSLLQRVSKIALVGTALAGSASGAFAQASVPARPGPAITTPKDDKGLETIVVTAQRRETQVQRTPLAVSAFTARDLQRRQIDSTLDVIRQVPNLSGSHNTGLGLSNSYYLRGAGNGESLSTFDVPVGTYVDEVYIARQNANQINLFDVERIEVLRGPQGTLFGRNTTGGAINIITKKPDNHLSFSGELGYGNYNHKMAKASINVPLSDRLFAKLSGYYNKDDGTIKSVVNGTRFNGDDGKGGRLAVRALFSDNVSWDAAVEYTDENRTAQGTALDIAKTVAANGEGAAVSGSLFRSYSDLRHCGVPGDYLAQAFAKCSLNRAKTFAAYSKMGFNLGDATKLEFITGYRNTTQRFVIDFLDNHPQQPFGPFVAGHFLIASDGKFEQFSQEVKLVGSFGDRLRYVAGVFYMSERNDTKFADLIGEPLLLLVDRDLKNGTKSYAGYVQGDFKIADRLTLTAGARLTREDKYIRLDYRPTFGPRFTEAALGAFGYPTKLRTTKTTPRISLQFQVNNDLMTYVSATNGFKSGGWNGRTDSAQLLNNFGPETVWSYEAGLRSELLDHRLRINATVFQADYKGLQISTEFPNTTSFVTTNAGDSRVRGAELEVNAVPAPGLIAQASLGLMNATFTRISAGAVASGFTSATKPLQTPDVTANFGLSYSTEINAAGEFSLAGNVSKSSSYYFDYPNRLDQKIIKPWLLDLSVAQKFMDGRLRLSLECKNCTDRHWSAQQLFSLAYPGDPRRVLFRIGYRFE
jgi:iron complex outermembrane receptor protein